jgi:hypothetical protein
VSKSRPLCLILDAGPIIGLHELGAWKTFVERYEVVVPQLVLDDEALFHSKDAATGHSEPILLAADVGAGRVLVAAASLNVSFGGDPNRAWDEAAKYGFIAAGGGA